MALVTVVGSYAVSLTLDVDHVPALGETAPGRGFRITDGGAGANAAVAAVRLGAEVRFVGRVGNDQFGARARDLLRTEGVFAALQTSHTATTAVGLALTGPTGDKAIAVEWGANTEMKAADVRAARTLLEAADVVLTSLEIPPEAALEAVAIAGRKGRKAVLDPAPARDLRGLPLTDVFALCPAEREARVCLGLAPGDETPLGVVADRLLTLGPRHVVIALTDGGALWASGEGQRRVPPVPVAAVDHTGAEEAFTAGLAVGIAERRPMLDAVALAVATGCLSTERRDGIPSFPRRAQADAHVGGLVTSITAVARS